VVHTIYRIHDLVHLRGKRLLSSATAHQITKVRNLSSNQIARTCFCRSLRCRINEFHGVSNRDIIRRCATDPATNRRHLLLHVLPLLLAEERALEHLPKRREISPLGLLKRLGRQRRVGEQVAHRLQLPTYTQGMSSQIISIADDDDGLICSDDRI
jgi:hypothetical protein